MKKIIVVILFYILCFNLYAQKKDTGYVVFKYSDGKISSEGHLKDGKPNGYWKNYYQNGALKNEGNRKNFKLDSIWKFYDINGKISKTITYKEDKKMA